VWEGGTGVCWLLQQRRRVLGAVTRWCYWHQAQQRLADQSWRPPPDVVPPPAPERLQRRRPAFARVMRWLMLLVLLLLVAAADQAAAVRTRRGTLAGQPSSVGGTFRPHPS
jgi:hypothetical protein